MTRFSKTMAALLVVALTGLVSVEAQAGGRGLGCGAAQKGCGCDKGGCGKVLKLVCVDREIEVDCWACKCDEVIIPGKSRRGPRNVCHDPCVECGKDGKDGKGCGCGLQGRGKKVCWFDWEPGCARTKVVKKLYKKTIKKKVPGWEWQLVDECKAVKGYDGPAAAEGEDGAIPMDPPEVRSYGAPSAPVGDVHVGSLDETSYAVQQASATEAPQQSLYHQIKDLIK